MESYNKASVISHKRFYSWSIFRLIQVKQIKEERKISQNYYNNYVLRFKFGMGTGSGSIEFRLNSIWKYPQLARSFCKRLIALIVFRISKSGFVTSCVAGVLTFVTDTSSRQYRSLLPTSNRKVNVWKGLVAVKLKLNCVHTIGVCPLRLKELPACGGEHTFTETKFKVQDLAAVVQNYQLLSSSLSLKGEQIIAV